MMATVTAAEPWKRLHACGALTIGSAHCLGNSGSDGVTGSPVRRRMKSGSAYSTSGSPRNESRSAWVAARVGVVSSRWRSSAIARLNTTLPWCRMAAAGERHFTSTRPGTKSAACAAFAREAVAASMASRRMRKGRTAASIPLVHTRQGCETIGGARHRCGGLVPSRGVPGTKGPSCADRSLGSIVPTRAPTRVQLRENSCATTWHRARYGALP